MSAVSDTEPRVQLVKTQQRRARRRCHELQHFPLVDVGKGLHRLPEIAHAGVLEPVGADGVEAAVLGVFAQIGKVDLGAVAADEGLEFALVKHGEPGRGDDGAQAFEKSVGLLPRLKLQAMTGEARDVDETICICDGDLGAVGSELVGDGFTWISR